MRVEIYVYVDTYYKSSLHIIIIQRQKGKRTVYHRTGHEGPEGKERYSSTLSLTSALDGSCGQRHSPAVLPPGMIHYPLHRRLGLPQCRSGRMQKILPPTWILSPDRSAHRELLYQLRYPGPSYQNGSNLIITRTFHFFSP